VRLSCPNRARGLSNDFLRLILACVALGLSLGGCPARAVRLDDVTTATDDPTAEAAFRGARESFLAGDLRGARAGFEAFVQGHARDPLVPAARLYVARVDLAEGRTADARERLTPLRASGDEALALQATFVDGLVLAAMGPGEQEEALRTLEPFAGRLVDRTDAAVLYAALVGLLGGMGRPGEALRHVDSLLRVVPDGERSDVRDRMRALIESCTAAQAEAAYASLPRTGEAWPALALRRARSAVDDRDSHVARAIADDMAAALGEEDLRVVEAREMLVDRQEVDPRAIGAILPLSGRGRELGAAALRGLLVAAGALDAREIGDGGFRLALRDDGGDAERASHAVTDLIETDHVIAIVGSLETATAEAAARAAENAGVPILSLSPQGGLTRIGPHVFRACLTAEIEARALARHAAERLGLRRIGVVSVDAPYGSSLRAAFESRLRELGASVVATAVYPAGTTTFGPVLRPILDANDVQGVLVIDTARAVGLVAPALAAEGLWSRPAGGAPPAGGRAVQVLLPSLAFDAALPRQASRYLEGAVVATGFFGAAGTPGTASFVTAYRERFEAEPGTVAAFAHDAFLRVRAAVEAGAIRREAVREALRTMRPAGGASVLGPFGETREPAEGVRLLRVVGTEFREI